MWTPFEQPFRLRLPLAWNASSRNVVLMASFGFAAADGLALAMSFSVFSFRVGSLRDRILWSRYLLLFSLVQAAVMIVWNWKSLARRLAEFFRAQGPALDLALFRMVVTGSLLFFVGQAQPHWYTTLPSELRVAPDGLAWLPETWLFNSRAVAMAEVAFSPICVCALVGFLTRFTMPLTAVLSLWLVALTHFDGKVDHDHHLIWFALLLAVSPCADALSVDALFRRRNPPVDSIGYALPIRMTWLLIGALYFFPGFWKLWSCGLDWAAPVNLSSQLHAKWMELGGWMPVCRIDRNPFILWIGGIGTILFELSFLSLLLFPKTRWTAVVMGQAFHFSTWVFMGISFWSLQLCYLAFIPWGRWFSRSAPGQKTSLARSWHATAFVGVVLMLGNLWCGFAHRNDMYPWTCYPTFDSFNEGRILQVAVVAESSKETSGELDLKRTFGPMGPAGILRLQYRLVAALRKETESPFVSAIWSMARSDVPNANQVENLRFAASLHEWSDAGPVVTNVLTKNVAIGH